VRLGLLGAVLLGTTASADAGARVSFRNVPMGLYGTGLDAQGSPRDAGSVDPHYALIQRPAGCGGVSCQESAEPWDLFGPAVWVVLGPDGTFPLIPGVWSTPNDPNSQWIGPRADQTSPTIGGGVFPSVEVFASADSPYVYRQLFNLTALGLEAATAQVILLWASDGDSGASESSHIRLCTVESAGSPPCPPEAMVPNSANAGPASELTPVVIPQGEAGPRFAAGLQALDFFVYNPPASGGEAANPSGLRVDVLIAEAAPEPAATAIALAAAMALIALRRLRSLR
jgi:hypothetical protein